jgi:predicted RNA-binding protein with PIN domain
MKTILVVDGYNVINAIPKVREKIKKDLRSARNAAILIIKEYVRSSGYITDFKVVFDGSTRYRHLETHEIPKPKEQVFSETGKGDDKIIETVKKCSRSGKVVLASNDNYVINNARAYGASIIDVRDLLKKKKNSSKEKHKTKKRINKNTKDEITAEYRKKLGV